MKYTNIKTLFLILFVGMLSCEEGIIKSPEQSLDESKAYANGAAAAASLNGVYSQSQLLEVFGSGPQIFEDLMSDNTDFVGSFPTIQDVKNYATISTNATVQSYWQVGYRVINGANTIVDRVPGVVDIALTETQRNSMIGQAKFIRAIVYLQLVNQFAQPFNRGAGSNLGVPLILKGFDGTVELPTRSTVAQVHDQIIKDLTEALAAVPVSYPGTNVRGRATKGACAALLSRISLYRGEYQKAADFAKQVLDNTALYSIAANYGFYGSTVGSEHVFAIINSAVDNGRTGSGGWASYHRPATLGGRGDCPMTADLVADYLREAGDKRYTELSDEVTAADAQRKRMTRKFLDAVNNTDLSPIIRTSEIALTRAEALAEISTAGINQESITLVNPIRVRAGLAPWTLTTFTSKAAFIDAILTERRKELAFEGHRRMDLLRRGQALRKTGQVAAAAAVFGADKTILPIPQREIDLNKGLVQNSGYQ